MDKLPSEGEVPGIVDPRGSLRQRVHRLLRGRHAHRVEQLVWHILEGRHSFDRLKAEML